MDTKKLKKSQIAVSKELIDVIRKLSIKTDYPQPKPIYPGSSIIPSPTIKFSKIYHFPDIWITSSKARICYTDSVYFGNEEKLWKYFPHIVTGTFPDKFPEQFLPKWGFNGERGFWIDGEKFYKSLKRFKTPIINFGNTKKKYHIEMFSKENPKTVITLGITNSDRNTGNNPSDEIGFAKLRRRIKNSQNLEANILQKDIPFLTKRNTTNKYLAIESVDGKPRIRGKIKDRVIFDTGLEKVKSSNKRFHFSFYQGFLKRLPKGDYKVIFSESGSIWENQTDKQYSVITHSAEFYNPNTGEKEQATQHWLDKPKTLNQFNEGYSMSDFPKLYPKENKQIQKDSKQVAIAWQKGVDAIIETGNLLLSAKKRYAKNDLFWNTFLETLPFSKRTMDRLIFIAEKKSILMSKKIYPQLPPNWGTLYELVTIGNEKTPIPRYENKNGEISDTKKKGYTEITLSTKDFIVKALDEDTLHPDATRNEITNYKRNIEEEYFEVKPKRKIDKPLEFVIRASAFTTKKDIQQFKEGLDTLLQTHSNFSLRN